MVNEFTMDIEGELAVKELLDPKPIIRATQNTLNAVATAYRKESVNKAYSIFKIRKRRLKKDSSGSTTWIKRASRQRMESIIGYVIRRPGLQHFGTRKVNPKKGSPKVKVKRHDQAKQLERGFYQTMPSGGWGLWQRDGNKSRPFRRRTGPSIKQMYEYPDVRKPLEKALPMRVALTWDAKVRDQLLKARRRGG